MRGWRDRRARVRRGDVKLRGDGAAQACVRPHQAGMVATADIGRVAGDGQGRFDWPETAWSLARDDLSRDPCSAARRDAQGTRRSAAPAQSWRPPHIIPYIACQTIFMISAEVKGAPLRRTCGWSLTAALIMKQSSQAREAPNRGSRTGLLHLMCETALFSPTSLATNPERVSPRAAAASSFAFSNPLSSDRLVLAGRRAGVGTCPPPIAESMDPAPWHPAHSGAGQTMFFGNFSAIPNAFSRRSISS